LISRGKIVGGLSGLGKKGGGSFSKEDLAILELFSSHISIAIENAQIFQELKEQKKRAEITLKSIGDAVITTDAQGKVVQMNPVAERLTSWTEAQANGKFLSDIFNIVNARSRKPVDNPVEKVIANGDVVGLANHTVLISKHGKEFQISDSAAPIKDEFGNILGVILVFRDVSEEYYMQEALIENQARFHSILDNTPAVIYLKDREGRYLLINRQYEKLFNVSNDSVRNKTDYDIFPAEIAEKFTQNDKYVLQTKNSIEIEELAPRADGLHVYISVKFPLLDADGEAYGICGISTDITEHRFTEEALRRSQKMDAIGQLSGGIAHDFNNQLGVVIGYLDMLKRQMDENKPQFQWLETASKATLRCMDLTRQLLSFSRKQVKEKEQLNLNDCIVDMQTMINRSLTPQIRVDYFLADDLHNTLLDKGEFQDAMLNLVINARDAMPQGGVLRIETHNENIDKVQANRLLNIAPGKYIHVVISDNGKGMSKDVMEHIFDPFFTTKPTGKGTGLGMTMVYGFVNRYDGQIKIYSELGKGTKINIYLPELKPTDEVKVENIKNTREFPGGSESILIVEDEPDLLQLAAHYLDDLGYQILEAQDASHALSMLEKHPEIDLLFSDVLMPGGMNGYELAEQVLSIKPGIKILLTSGFVSDNIKNGLFQQYANDLLVKPYRKDVLAKRIRDVLDRQVI
ncbi:MAG TPA: PAS domain-containing protein, partial [Gammaproteobacteria bacterium]